MLQLRPNAINQQVYVTPFEARKFLPDFTDYLFVLQNVSTEETFACVPVLLYDNERYTHWTMRTNLEDVNNVRIDESGLYTYTIYGQNSSTNKDPNDASVVGICEIGPARFEGSRAWNIPTLDIPDNVIYYE